MYNTVSELVYIFESILNVGLIELEYKTFYYVSDYFVNTFYNEYQFLLTNFQNFRGY